MEPLGSTTATETAVPVDDGLQEAAQGLADQIDGQPAAPAAARPSAEPEPPKAPPTPSRAESYKRYQGGYVGRRQRSEAELRERRAREEQQTHQIRQQNQVMQQVLDVLRRSRGEEGAQEPIPDPNLEPEKFGQWLAKQTESTIGKALKPLLDANEKRDQLWQQQQEDQQREEQERRQVEEVTYHLQDAARAYEAEQPEMAHGHEERVHLVRDLVTGAFQDIGRPDEEAAGMANMILFAVARSAEASHENPVAAIDGFCSSLVGRLSQMLGVPFEPSGPNGNGNGHHRPAAAPQNGQAEIERLNAVKARVSPAAGNAAPRLVGRSGEATSELKTLWNAGERSTNRLRAAALKDSGGNMNKAQQALGELIDAM